MHRSIIRPRPLPAGGTIGVFTPSTPANVLFREKYQHGLGVLRSLGYRVVEGSLTARGVSQGYRSGTPEERATEFMDLVLDDSVHCLMSAIGGMNSSSMIPYLDFDIIRACPKIICGYSDMTSLHLAVLAYSGLATFYGPAVMPSFGEWPTVLPYMLGSFLDATARHTEGGRVVEPPEQWSNHFRDAVGDAWRTEPREFRANEGWRALRPGAATAPIVGGNLETLLIAAGTGYFPELEGTILMIEDVSGDLAAAERGLRQLELMGVFDRIVGLVVSKPEFPARGAVPFTNEELLIEVVGQRDYPIVTNFDCGHTVPMLTIAQMTRTTLTAGNGYDVTMRFEEPMVWV